MYIYIYNEFIILCIINVTINFLSINVLHSITQNNGVYHNKEKFD